MRVICSRELTTVLLAASLMGASALMARGVSSRTVCLTRKSWVGRINLHYTQKPSPQKPKTHGNRLRVITNGTSGTYVRQNLTTTFSCTYPKRLSWLLCILAAFVVTGHACSLVRQRTASYSNPEHITLHVGKTRHTVPGCSRGKSDPRRAVRKSRARRTAQC